LHAAKALIMTVQSSTETIPKNFFLFFIPFLPFCIKTDQKNSKVNFVDRFTANIVLRF